MIAILHHFKKYICALCFALILFLCLPTGNALANHLPPPDAQHIQGLLAPENMELDPDIFNKAELNTLYAARDYEPAWDTRKSNQKGLEAFLANLLAYANFHGLLTDRYPTRRLKEEIYETGLMGSARLELLISQYVMILSHALQGDDVDLKSIYFGWTFTRPKKDVPTDLAIAIKDNKLQNFLDSLAPHNAKYAQILNVLNDLKNKKKSQPIYDDIPYGNTIRVGEKDARLPAIRQRLIDQNLVFPQSIKKEDRLLYDPSFMEAIKEFQNLNELEPDGNIGNRTIEALNTSIHSRIVQTIANLERLRNFPEELPNSYIWVNIANATIHVVQNGRTVYDDVVIVGARGRNTPFIDSKVRSIIINPTWDIPASIARNDILPKIKADPEYLEKMGMAIKGNDADPFGKKIDWNKMSSSRFNFSLRQAPGDMNALGRIKFTFDNGYVVYLHDTSKPELFAKIERHLSSGCIRVKEPLRLAEVLSQGNKKPMTRNQIESIIETNDKKWVRVEKQFPIYIVYDTVILQKNNSEYHFARDIYGYDKRLIKTLMGPSESNIQTTSPPP